MIHKFGAKTPTYFVDAGDAFFQALAIASKEEKKLRSMADGITNIYNAMGCKVMNVGRNDLALGAEFITHIQSTAKFPMISANIISLKSGQPAFEPYFILETPDLKIGLIGVTLPNPNASTDYKFNDPLTSAQGAIDAIKSDVDVVIVLASLEDSQIPNFVAGVKGADFVVSSRSFRVSSQPKTDANGVTLIQNGTRGKYAGILHVKRSDKVGTLRNLSPERNQLSFTYDRLEDLEKPVPPGMTVDEYYQDDGAKTQLLGTLRNQKQQREKIINESKNNFWFIPIALSADVVDDPDILLMVNETKTAAETAATN